MLKVGLTGNIAAGKSSVVAVWRSLGAWVIDADELARRAVAPGTPGLRAIEARWGQGLLDAGGALDRARMREIVFADAGERAALEAIVHPEVARLRELEYRRAEQAGARVAVSDIPLLFEVGLDREFDLVVLVDAPAETRLARIVRDRGLSEEAARRMIEAQMPSELKRARADLVIDNVGGREELGEVAHSAWTSLLSRLQGRRESL